MKALSLTQPWATLVAVRAKRIETRSWRTNYRGPIAIHASKGYPGWARELAMQVPFKATLPITPLPRSAVVAKAKLVGCLPIVDFADLNDRRGEPVVAVDDEGIVRIWRPLTLGHAEGHSGAAYPHAGENEVHYGDYTPGRWAWLLEDVEQIEPIPASGRLGIWEWEEAA